MNRITNEQREAIVRKAIAERDAILAGKADCAGGSTCSDCPDKRKCERGCIRQQEFISTEFHVFQRIRAGIAADRCDGESEWANGVNAACANHLKFIDTVLAEAGSPRKLWLWKNFVEGRPEYWAFDNPYPINLTDGDPQTLGEPCGYAIFKPSRQGRTDVSEELVLQAIARTA